MNNNTDTKEEIKYFAKRALLIDVGVYLVWSLISGFGISMLFGLLLGTVAIILDMFMLHKQILTAVELSKYKVQGKSKTMFNFVVRMLVLSLFIIAGFLLKPIHPLGVLVPMVYPKIIYTIAGLKKQ